MTEDALGVREWKRCARAECGSGGLDSYTKVSSESDESASSTALATFASKMSAFEEAIIEKYQHSTSELGVSMKAWKGYSVLFRYVCLNDCQIAGLT